MKKGLMIFTLGILSFLGINSVNAETYDFEYSLSEYSESGLTEEQLIQYLDEKLDIVLEYWEENLKEEYPYYYVGINTTNIGSRVDMDFIYLKDISIDNSYYKGDMLSLINTNQGVLNISIYCSDDSNCNDEIIERPSSFMGYFNPLFYIRQPYAEVEFRHYLPFSYYTSNFDFIFNETDTYNIIKDGEVFYSLKKGDIIPTYKDLFVEDIKNKYTEINLNDYSYVILSLKDYTPRETYTSTMFVKGQLCPTTVYNYGLEEKKDYISGYQTQGCGYYSNNYRRYLTYIKTEDIKNHAVYYLTGYDSSLPNSVKVDNTVYNITYITSENENDPYVSINGKNFPALPYSSLTDTATLTEKFGVNNTWTCAKYDTNCYLNSSGIDVGSLFEQPLETLKTIWDTITSIFTLITQFILLLPPTMQGFLYIAFGIGISLGIIKMLIG